PQGGRQHSVDPSADFLPLPLVEYAGEDHAEADQGYNEGESEHVPEDVEGEIAEIAGDAESAEHGVDAAIEKDREADQEDIERAVHGLADFRRLVGGADRAPKSERAEKMEPEAEIAGGAPLQVKRPGEENHRDAEIER